MKPTILCYCSAHARRCRSVSLSRDSIRLGCYLPQQALGVFFPVVKALPQYVARFGAAYSTSLEVLCDLAWTHLLAPCGLHPVFCPRVRHLHERGHGGGDEPFHQVDVPRLQRELEFFARWCCQRTRPMP